MMKPIEKKRDIFKYRLHFYLIFSTLLFILALLLIFPFKNLISDLYFQKYKQVQRDEKPLDNQIGYLYQSININPNNPKYFDELANLFFESHEDDLTSINSEAALREINQRSSFIHHPYYSKIFESPLISSHTAFYELMPISAHLQTIQFNPLNADNYLKLGLLLSYILYENKVNVLLKRAIDLEPQNIDVHFAIGSHYLWNQRIKEALDEFKQVLDIAAKQRTHTLIDIYLPEIMGQSFLLIKDVQPIKEIIPYSYYCYLKFAQFLAEKNKPIDSKEYFYKAFQIAPKERREEILLSFAQQSAKSKDWDELIKIANIYQKIKTDDKNFSQLNVLLSQAYYNKGEYEKAIQTADNALLLDPSNSNLHYYKGLSYFRISQNLKAVRSFKKAVELAPDNPYMHIQLANAYHSIGDLESALSQWQIVLELSSSNADISTQAINHIIKIKSELLKSRTRN